MVGKFLMLSWKIWQGDAATWDNLLIQFSDYTIYQSYAWGEHRSHFGWLPHRLTATENGQTVAMAQILARRFPLSITLAWVPGGPVGPVETWGESFRAATRQVIGTHHLYCRVNPMREHISLDMEHMRLAGWLQPRAPLNTGISLSYKPSENEDTRITQASGNWRHNLRRSLKYKHVVSVWPNPDPDEILVVYEAMQSHKKLAEQISRSALISMLAAFGKQCIVVRCNDAQGRLLALRGALLFGDKAWDIFAAATPEARKVYASHAAFWELMKQCALRGVQWYDMSGVDPVGNRGVYDFKKGTGASKFLYLGEWDWATSSLLRHVANCLIKRRARGM